MRKRTSALILCLCVILAAIPALPSRAADAQIMFTGVNREPPYPLTQRYMALLNSDGSILVPHTLLTDSEIAAKVDYSSQQRYVTLTCSGKSITFEIASYTAFDASGQTYDTRVLRDPRGGTTYYYFELEFLKSYFGWYSWPHKSEYGYLLRLTTKPEIKEHNLYYYQHKSLLKQYYEQYYGIVPSPAPSPSAVPGTSSAPGVSNAPAAPSASAAPPSVPPSVPPPPDPLPIEEEPLGVYLTFDGPVSETAAKLAALLERHGLKGAFFLEPEGLDSDPALLRRLTATHLVGLCGTAGPEDTAAMTAELAEAARIADAITLIKPQLLRLPGLTGDTADALAEQGYRIWGWTADASVRPSKQSAAKAAKAILDSLPSPESGPAVLRFGITEDSLETLEALLPDLMDGTKYFIRTMNFLDRPII